MLSCARRRGSAEDGGGREGSPQHRQHGAKPLRAAIHATSLGRERRDEREAEISEPTDETRRLGGRETREHVSAHQPRIDERVVHVVIIRLCVAIGHVRTRDGRLGAIARPCPRARRADVGLGCELG